jgi:hypothetical protein
MGKNQSIPTYQAKHLKTQWKNIKRNTMIYLPSMKIDPLVIPKDIV